LSILQGFFTNLLLHVNSEYDRVILAITEGMFSMRRKKIAAALVAFLVFATSLTGCNLFKQGGGESSVPVSSSSKPAAVSSSSDFSTAPESSEQAESSSPESSSTSSSANQVKTSSTTDQLVFPIETNNKAFDALFKKNPIDASYIANAGSAYSNTAVTQLNQKYAGYWQTEIDSAYKKLLETANSTDKSTFKAEQEQWVTATPAALKKISKDVLAAGGSAPQVEVSSKIMEYYRTRAAQVYKELYGYNKNYTYAFTK
jgi:uncharacterized protein YecT (DUF1311 family)/predicted small secreted protein